MDSSTSIENLKDTSGYFRIMDMSIVFYIWIGNGHGGNLLVTSIIPVSDLLQEKDFTLVSINY